MEICNKGVMGTILDIIVQESGIEALSPEDQIYYNKVKDNVGWSHFDKSGNLVQGQESNAQVLGDFLDKCNY
jgi:hypothetical protein